MVYIYRFDCQVERFSKSLVHDGSKVSYIIKCRRVVRRRRKEGQVGSLKKHESPTNEP